MLGAKPKIFVIGFNRCGTTSLHMLFRKNGITALHYHGPEKSFIVPAQLSLNLSLGRPLISGLNRWTAFSDLGMASQRLVFEGARLFRQLHAEHPDAYFILNTRPVGKWIKSRLAHMQGRYVRNFAEAMGQPESKMPQIWRKQQAAHHGEVRDYFAGHDRFLEFDIEADDPRAVQTLLAPDFRIDVTHWALRNATKAEER